LFLIWNRALTPEEVMDVSANPWQVFQPQSPQDRYWVGPAPAIGDVPFVDECQTIIFQNQYFPIA